MLYPIWSTYFLDDSITVNFGATSFQYTPPVGYQPFDNVVSFYPTAL